MRKFLYVMMVFALLLGMGTSVFASEDEEVEQEPVVEIIHWWTSGGEAAALNVLKGDLEAQGIEWIDVPIAGGGGTEAMVVLASRMTAGNPPIASQMLGFSILDWAEQGVTANLNEVAEEENWDAVIPEALQKFAKYDGKWHSAPVNVHSTNWVWTNLELLDELGLEIPETWPEFIDALETAKQAGYYGLGHGGQAWQDATIFDGVVIAVGGPEFYKATMIDLDDDALRSDTMLEVFNQMEVLRGYVDPNFSNRDWNLASAMVINGEALFQMMGDWAKGEFFAAGMEAGVDFMGFRTPGTQGVVTFNADQFVMFEVEPQFTEAQNTLASAILSPSFQVAFNTVKGSVPARTDVPDDEFTIIGKNGMRELAEAAANGTLFGSMAHGHASRPSVTNAMYDVITAHFNLQISSAEAVQQLADAVADAQL